MSNKHYYIMDDTQPKGFEEMTETEFFALLGDDTTRPYATKVYNGTMSIDEVPEELREAVSTVAANKVVKWGTYENRNIPDLQDFN